MTDDERKWCVAAWKYGGDFVKAFAEACMRADDANEEILKPALENLMRKYPHYSSAPLVQTVNSEMKRSE